MGIPIIGDIINEVGDLISEVVVDKDKRDELNFRFAELKDRVEQRLHEQMIAQTEVNKAEASSGSVFVAGWRPAVGWIAAAGLAWTFVLAPFVETVARWLDWSGNMPEVDTASLLTLILGMLGIGGMRSYEKVKGVSTNDYTDVPSRQQEAPLGGTSPEIPPKPKRRFKL